MKIFVAVLLMVSCVLEASARIGETEAETRARYGKPKLTSEAPEGMRPADVFELYSAGGWEIAAVFYKGKCVSELFMKEKKAALNMPMAISSKELQFLMEKNGEGQSWRKDDSDPIRTSFARSDGKIKAMHDGVAETFQLIDSEFLAVMVATNRGSEKKSLSSF